MRRAPSSAAPFNPDAMQPAPIILALPGGAARLEPLRADHAPDLFAASRPHIWRFMAVKAPTVEIDVLAWIATALDNQRAGTDLPFAIIHVPSGRAVGSTRYLEIQPAHRSLEIGWTWITPDLQRTAINTECKLLLLRHAFEDLGCVRVQLKCDARNTQSRAAIERLGAVKEGVLRHHRVMPDGFLRDTVCYSILAAEWPAVRAGLETRLSVRPERAGG